MRLCLCVAREWVHHTPARGVVGMGQRYGQVSRGLRRTSRPTDPRRSMELQWPLRAARQTSLVGGAMLLR
jgi:hypothetical protein